VELIALTIGGLPGTGTTTVAKLLREELGIRYVYTGDIFREMARERKMEVAEFGDYVREHPEIDRELDRRQVELARESDIIIEGRLAGYMAHHHGVEAYKIWLHATPEIRAERVAGRESKTTERVLAENTRREDGERLRYMEIYDYDIRDTSFYDIDIDSGRYLPTPIRDLIVEDLISRGIANIPSKGVSSGR